MLSYCSPQEKTKEETVVESVITEVKWFIIAPKTSEKYGTNIEYYDFSKIPFETIPEKGIKVPRDLENILKRTKPSIASEKTFKELVLQEAEKIGYSETDLSKLSCKKAVEATVDITANRIKYHSVDSDIDFIKKYGNDITHDRYFEIGLGDCDKYAAITIGVFDIIKENNNNLKNVYLSNSTLGGDLQLHEWNSLVILKEDAMMLSHLDPTFYDNGGELEAREGYHIHLNKKLFLGRFYRGLLDYDKALEIYKSVFDEVGKEEQEYVCMESSSIAYLKGSLEEFEWIEEPYYSNKLTEGFDKILYNHYDTLKKLGKKEEARKKKKELLERFPDSFWSKMLKEKS